MLIVPVHPYDDARGAIDVSREWERRETPMGNPKQHRIDVYSSECAICEDTLELVQRLAGSDHQVFIHDVRRSDIALRAKQLGVRRIPAVFVNGKLLGCCDHRGCDEQLLLDELC